MNDPGLNIEYQFADYGTPFETTPGRVVVDVGMRLAPGVLDHHHPEAEAECAASLVVKHPELVLDHIRPGGREPEGTLTFVTHKLPDFDALAAIFLARRLIERGEIDPAMRALAAYTMIVDSSALPPALDLAATPYAVLRGLFAGAGKSEETINRERTEEGLKFMRHLHARAEEGAELMENPRLFQGIDRYERAVRKIGEDFQNYLADAARSPKFGISLPLPDGSGRRTVDGLSVARPHCFLLKEWARRDRAYAPGGKGFSFVMSLYGDSRFIIGVDPAAGVNLRGLGGMLNALEQARRAELGRPAGPPWYEGAGAFFEYRIVDSPRDESVLAPAVVFEAVKAFGRVEDFST
ncbi:MAG: hypothetical protein NTZ26_12400 [Candidatus Aminicenantes bacterium]|nr:hypothetical protein [Candidatus Aminicenantes bacterium]